MTQDPGKSNPVFSSVNLTHPVDRDGQPRKQRHPIALDIAQIRATARRLAELAEIEAIILRSISKGNR